MAMQLDYALKQIEWEAAKGHLRALCALQGSYVSTDNRDYETIRKRVEKFIKDIEDNGLHE